jgi:hypothetical protein
LAGKRLRPVSLTTSGKGSKKSAFKINQPYPEEFTNVLCTYYVGKLVYAIFKDILSKAVHR